MNETDHIKSLLRWLRDDVKSAGGDGDAIWFSKYHSVEKIASIIVELGFTDWKLEVLEPGGTLLWYGPPEESIVITNDQKVWDRRPSWQQVSIHW